MRREELYLRDIVEAAEQIKEFIADNSQEDFLTNDMLRSAVLQKLMIIGEASARLPKDFRDRHQEIPWSKVVAFRNISIHAYFAVDWSLVWSAATQDTPRLKQDVSRILADEYQDNEQL